jgi:5'-3' exonuclease
MGIKHFFIWFRQNFPQHIHALKRTEHATEVVDNLMIDMNGIFHTATQKVYQYGNHKPPKRLLGRPRVPPSGLDAQLAVFQEICRILENIAIVCRPRRRLILCVDGPAPAAKMCQQRSRRFRSAKEASKDSTIRDFDTNSITPGTKFMDFLTKYIDWYIRKRLSDPDSFWQDIEIVFSNEKAPGEGELKILSYIRYYGDSKESFCVHGLDADLIMHTLLTHLPRIYLLRDEIYDPEYEYQFINISQVSRTLSQQLKWSSPIHTFCPKASIHDFVFLCFLVGNDFLPQIPSLEILENGLDLLLSSYISICKEQGHITISRTNQTLEFSKPALHALLAVLGKYEQKNLESKLSSGTPYFPDKLLEKHATRVSSTQDASFTWKVDIDNYRNEYVVTHFNDPIEEVCHHYLEGMQWVLSYYTQGTTNWSWYFPYHYAPPASILAQHIESYSKPKYVHSRPSMPFEQLLCVLPPRSAALLPRQLSSFLSSPESPLAPFCPDDIEIDLSGKRREWEGITLLPILDRDIARKCYLQEIDNVHPRDSKRNVRGRSFIYNYNPSSTRTFKSFYGNIYPCKASMSLIDL